MVSANMYYYTKVMSQLFLDTPLSAGDSFTFRHISTMDDFWKVKKQTPLISALVLMRHTQIDFSCNFELLK